MRIVRRPQPGATRGQAPQEASSSPPPQAQSSESREMHAAMEMMERPVYFASRPDDPRPPSTADIMSNALSTAVYLQSPHPDVVIRNSLVVSSLACRNTQFHRRHVEAAESVFEGIEWWCQGCTASSEATPDRRAAECWYEAYKGCAEEGEASAGCLDGLLVLFASATLNAGSPSDPILGELPPSFMEAAVIRSFGVLLGCSSGKDSSSTQAGVESQPSPSHEFIRDLGLALTMRLRGSNAQQTMPETAARWAYSGSKSETLSKVCDAKMGAISYEAFAAAAEQLSRYVAAYRLGVKQTMFLAATSLEHPPEITAGTEEAADLLSSASSAALEAVLLSKRSMLLLARITGGNDANAISTKLKDGLSALQGKPVAANTLAILIRSVME